MKIKNKFKDLNLFEKMLILSPVALFFSYLPNFFITKISGTNIELSIAIIYVFIMAGVGFVDIIKLKKQINIKNVILPTLFVIWNFTTLIWSENKLRTILTAGLWGTLLVIFITITLIDKTKRRLILERFTYIFLDVAFLMTVLSIIQVAYGAFWDIGLCKGCLARGFGFVRPSVFTIEPQFLGSLLLMPILVLIDRIINKHNKKDALYLFIIALSMYLTLSRGAIFALFVAILCYYLYILYKGKIKINKTVLPIFIIGCSFIFGILYHAFFTELNPRISDNAYESISKSINHLSLGKISLPKIEENKTKITSEKALFNGYVERSTDERTNMTNLGIETWLRDIKTSLFGVGSGGSGKAIFKTTHKTGNSFEIVQNEFISILLELGIIGFIIWITNIIFVIKKFRFNGLYLSILVAFMVQWLFFSGLPNALHIYIILMVFVGLKEKD